MKLTLTESRVRDLKAPIAGRSLVHDEKVRGLAIRVTTAGSKSFVVYRRIGGRPRYITLGQFPQLSVEHARKLAAKIHGEIADGQDPATDRAAAKAQWTLEELWERYIEQHARERKKTWRSDAARWRLYLRPWAKRPISSVSRSNVAALHSRVGRATGRIAANRLRSLISKMFNLARVWGADVENPTIGVEKFSEQMRHRYLSREEFTRLGTVLSEAERDTTQLPEVIAALRLLIFTGARYSEILGLRWEWLDTERGEFRLPESKTGFKVVHLNEAAMAVLAMLPRTSPWVLPGRRPGQHFVGLQHPWARIRANADLADVRIHDLRHSFASVAVSGGMSLPMIGALLGHSQPATTARYAHLAAHPLKEAASLIGQDIVAAMGSTKATNLTPGPNVHGDTAKRVRSAHAR